MGGCANSKYAVDEDNQVKKEKKPFLLKKSKKQKEPIVDTAQTPVITVDTNGDVKNHVDETKTESNEPHGEHHKEDIEFMDKEDAEQQNATTVTTESNDAKKEVTTYQTTVVKHTQKEGDELLQHLKDEAFKTLQTSLKQLNLNQNRTQTTTASSSVNQTPETATEDSTEDLLQQIKAQVLKSLGKTNEDLINTILDSGASLIKENKVKNMSELEVELVKSYPDSADLTKKVINSTTGFLTAKGTEAGVILSNILANVNSGIQGIMNETEKTTVKVTRTVTEQVLSGGQMKEITRIITEPVSTSNQPNLDDILKNLSSDSKVVKTGTTVTSVNTTVNENQETLSNDKEAEQVNENELADKAEEVVTKVVNAAVEQINNEASNQNNEEHQEVPVTNGFHNNENGHLDENSLVEENIKVEEESTVRTSTTKIVLNGTSEHLEQVQAEFLKQGKQHAEEVVKKLNTEISSNTDVEQSSNDNNN